MLRFSVLWAVTGMVAWCAAAENPPALQQDPAIVSGVLDNGLRYMFRHTDEPKGRGSLRLYVRNGSLDEKPEEAGVSHLLEHMVFNGSRHYRRGELIPAMQQLGLGYGGDANAFTLFDNTYYALDLPNLKPETLQTAFTILRDFADGATLEEDALEHERGVIISEKNQSDSAAYRASVLHMEQLSEGTRLVEALPIGREEVIRSFSADQLRRFYREHYVPGLMTVIVTGDMSAEQAEQLVKEHFGSMEAAPLPPAAEAGTFRATGPSERLIPNPEQANTDLILAVMEPYVARPDGAETRMEKLPLNLACAMLAQRLAAIARDPHAPLAKASVSYEQVMKTSRGLCIKLSTMPSRWPEAMNAAVTELRRACTYGFRPEECRQALAGISRSYRDSMATAAARPADSVADGIVRTLQEDSTYVTPEEGYRVFRLGAERILADPDCCRRALAAVFDAARVKLTLMGKLPKDLTPEQLREGYEKALQLPVGEEAAEEKAEFRYEPPKGEPATVTDRATFNPPGVTTLRLSNGVRLNLKPEPAAKGKIAVNVALQGGSLSMPKPGMSLLAEDMLNQGGFAGLSRDDMGRLWVDRSVGLTVSMDARYLHFSSFTTREDLELQLQILLSAITRPDYTREGSLRLERQLPAMHNRARTTAEAAFSRAGTRMVFGEDSRMLLPTLQQVKDISREELIATLTPLLQEAPMEVSMVGDFELEGALPLLEQTFGRLPQRREPSTVEQATVTPAEWGRSETVTYSSALDKTVVGRLISAGDGDDPARSDTVRLLCSILQNRLFDAIRARLGEGYAPFVSYDPNAAFREAALITVESPGVMRNLEIVNEAMDKVLADFAQGNITTEELENAKRPAVAAILRSYTDAAFWARAIRTIQSEPDTLQQTLDRYSRVEGASADALNDAARAIFGSGRIDKINVIPEAPKAE